MVAGAAVDTAPPVMSVQPTVGTVSRSKNSSVSNSRAVNVAGWSTRNVQCSSVEYRVPMPSVMQAPLLCTAHVSSSGELRGQRSGVSRALNRVRQAAATTHTNPQRTERRTKADVQEDTRLGSAKQVFAQPRYSRQITTEAKKGNLGEDKVQETLTSRGAQSKGFRLGWQRRD